MPFTRANTPLFEIVVPLAAGIVCAESFFGIGYDASTGASSGTGWLAWLLIFAACAIACALLWIFRKQKRPTLWLGCAAVGFLLALHSRTEQVIPKGERLHFISRIDNEPIVKGRWQQSESTIYAYALHDSLSNTRGEWLPTTEKTILNVDTSQRIAIGDIVEYRARMYPIDSAYGRYMARKGITGRSYTWRIETLHGSDTTFLQRVRVARGLLSRRFDRGRSRGSSMGHSVGNKEEESIRGNQYQTGTLLWPEGGNNAQAGATHNADTPNPHSALMRSLATGDRSTFDRSLRNDYTRTGTAHILAISGMHVGIIFMVLNLLLGWMRLFPRGRYWMGGLVIVLLIAYAFLTGLSPSVLRAVIMFSLLQVGLMLSRHTNQLNTLCAAALLLLLWNPLVLYDYSFQLSFAAMLGIITLYKPVVKLWNPKWKPLRWLWSLTVLGLVAQAGAQPLATYHFGQWPLAGIVLSPVIWFTVPAIVIGSLAYLACGWEWLYSLTHRIAAWQNNLVERMSSQSWVVIEHVEMPAWVCLLIYAALTALALWLNRPERRVAPMAVGYIEAA